MRLYPHDGMIIHMQDAVGRKRVESQLRERSSYMKGVKCSATLAKGTRQQKEHFMLYSPLSCTRSHKTPTADEDKESHENVAAFWAVMFCTGDTTGMINMKPLMEEYRLNNATPLHHGQMVITQKLKYSLPLMTNTIDLNEGDLLVMPFDGGLPEIVCERFPPLATPRETAEGVAPEGSESPPLDTQMEPAEETQNEPVIGE